MNANPLVAGKRYYTNQAITATSTQETSAPLNQAINAIPSANEVAGVGPTQMMSGDTNTRVLSASGQVKGSKKCDGCDGNCANYECFGCGGCNFPLATDSGYHDAFAGNAMALSGLVLYPFPKLTRHSVHIPPKRRSKQHSREEESNIRKRNLKHIIKLIKDNVNIKRSKIAKVAPKKKKGKIIKRSLYTDDDDVIDDVINDGGGYWWW